jgi:hypothetical protein
MMRMIHGRLGYWAQQLGLGAYFGVQKTLGFLGKFDRRNKLAALIVSWL